MEKERNVDRLAGYLIKLGGLAIIAALCWYFKTVLVYIAIAFVVSLIGRPVMKLLRKITIKKKQAPDWLLAILTLLLVIAVLVLVITQMVPMVANIVRDISALSSSSYLGSNPVGSINEWLVNLFPGLGDDFDVVVVIMDKLREVVNLSSVTGFVGSVASLAVNILVGLFSVMFIAFFFIKDSSLFEKIICALVPDKLESTMSRTMNEINQLLSRYFVGLLIEMLGVALLDFLGLWLIARLDFGYAIAIAFIAGLLNVIPYVGPIIGEAVGVIIGVVLKLGVGAGLDVNIWVFALVILAIMLTVQLVDNFIYQPVIYSTSIKAHPLEIFIVFLMAGHIGGTVGMLVAIPAYTVIRVVAFRFFYRFKLVQRLNPDLSDEDKILEQLNTKIKD